MLDNSLSKYLARALHALSEPHDHVVRHISDIVPENTPDVEWLKRLSDEGGWCIVSHDRFIKSPLEKEALRSSRIVTFRLRKGWSHWREWEKAWNLVRWWPHIIDMAERMSGGAAFDVPQRFSGKGKFEQVKL